MLTSTVRMDRWTIIYASKHESVAQNFIQTLYKVAKPMGFVVGNPKLLVNQDYNYNISNYSISLQNSNKRRSNRYVYKCIT